MHRLLKVSLRGREGELNKWKDSIHVRKKRHQRARESTPGITCYKGRMQIDETEWVNVVMDRNSLSNSHFRHLYSKPYVHIVWISGVDVGNRNLKTRSVLALL